MSEVTVPTVEPIVMNPTSIAPNSRRPKKNDPESYATFVTLKAAGKGHTVLIRPTAEEDVQMPGERGPRRIPIQGSCIKVRFAEGTYTTNDPNIIEILLDEKTGFGRDYDINRHDPTGYWRKRGDFEVEVVESVTIKGGRTMKGAMSSSALNS